MAAKTQPLLCPAIAARAFRAGQWLPVTEPLRQSAGEPASPETALGYTVLAFDTASHTMPDGWGVADAVLRFPRDGTGVYYDPVTITISAAQAVGLSLLDEEGDLAIEESPALVPIGAVYRYTVTAGAGDKYIRMEPALATALLSGEANCLCLGTETEAYVGVSLAQGLEGIGLELEVGVLAINPCQAPTSVTFEKTTSSGEAVRLSWSGAAGGTYPVNAFMLVTQESPDGASWRIKEQYLLNVPDYTSSGDRMLSPPATQGAYLRAGVRATNMGPSGNFEVQGAGSDYAYSSNTLRRASPPLAPAVLNVSATLASGDIILSWSGAASGAGNPIGSYELEYSDSPDSHIWTDWTGSTIIETSATSGSTPAAIHSTPGYYRSYRIRTRSANDETIVSPWTVSGSVRRNIPPGNITRPAVNPKAFYGDEQVTVTWTAASQGTSPIKTYRVFHEISGDGGQTWTPATQATTVTAPLMTVTIKPAVVPDHSQIRYSVQAVDYLDDASPNRIYSSEDSITTRMRVPCSPPALLQPYATLVPRLGSTTLSWSGAQPGAGAPISGFELESSDSPNDAEWGAWTALAQVATGNGNGSLSVSANPALGAYRRFRVRAITSAGAAYYSGWLVSGSIRTNVPPSAPTTLTASPRSYLNPPVTLSWSGIVPGTSPIKQYYLYQRTSTDNGLTWSAKTYSAIEETTPGTYLAYPTTELGVITEYDVCPVDALLESPENRPTVTVRSYSGIAAPTIMAPAHDVNYTHRGNIRVLLAADYSQSLQTLYVSLTAMDGSYTGQWNSNANAHYFSTGYTYASYQHTIFTCPSAIPVGVAMRLSVWSVNNLGVTSFKSECYVTRHSLTLDTITAGQTHVKAQHITQLQAVIEAQRYYYGLPAHPWKSVPVAGQTLIRDFPSHILSLREEVQEVVNTVNAFDPNYAQNPIIPLAAWSPIGTRMPPAVVVTELQNLVRLM